MPTLDQLQAQITALQAQLDGMQATGEWPKAGEFVWKLWSGNEPSRVLWEGERDLLDALRHGNIFRTEAEATRERDRRALIAELRRHPKAIVPAWGSPPFYYLVRQWDKGWSWVTGYNFDCCPASGYFSERIDGLIEQLGSRLELLRDA